MQQDVNMLLQSIYDEYQESLRLIAMSYSIPNADVDDVVQETFIAYFSKYSLSWSPSRKKAMLIKILRRKAIDYLRKHNRYGKISFDDDMLINSHELLARFVITDPLEVLTIGEAYTEIKNEIMNMRQEWREIAVLYFIEGRSISEICTILQIPGNVCRSRIYRTRCYLRKILGPRYGF